jgi:hypothetical protein
MLAERYGALPGFWSDLVDVPGTRHFCAVPFTIDGENIESVVSALPGPDGEIGRRSGLKIRRPQGRGGSSPPPGTNKISNLYRLDRE